MHRKLKNNAEYAKKMSRIRSRTVEPVLGTLLNFTGMRRVNTRGIKGAEKHVLMSALAYNLKKYIKFIRRKSITKSARMVKEQTGSFLKNITDLIKRILERNAPLIFGY